MGIHLSLPNYLFRWIHPGDKIDSGGRMLPTIRRWSRSLRSVRAAFLHCRSDPPLGTNMLSSFLCIWAAITATSAVNYFEAQELGPCPHALPTSDVPLKELEGKWHLSVVVLDATKEDIEENSVCVNGQIFVNNATHMKHVWDMYTPHHLEIPVATFELSMSVIRPGMWAVQTPIGSQMTATFFAYDVDLAMASFCGWQRGQQVHVFTAAVTREGTLTSAMRLKMSSVMLDNGYRPSNTKLIVWNKC